MKARFLYNAILGIATEIFYAMAIVLAALLICVAAYFLRL